MRHQKIDDHQMSESESFISQKEKNMRNSRMSKNSSAKKAPLVNKKLLSRIMLYTEMDFCDDELYVKHLKTIPFGKEKKKPQAKMEKLLWGTL